MEHSDLSADPRIERLELRHELERVRARWRLAACAILVAGLATGQVVVGEGFVIPLALASGILGVAFDRWVSAGAADERMARDLRTLTTVYHESPATIRRWLTPQFIEDSIRNLLAAALDSDELGHAYWTQAVEPFVAESQKGYKTDWRYQIDIADLPAPILLGMGDSPVGVIAGDSHHRLHTTIAYTQRIPNPSDIYYVAVVFEQELPEWSKQSNILLRELIEIPPAVQQWFARFPQLPPQLPGETDDASRHDSPDAHIAKLLMSAELFLGDTPLQCTSLCFDSTGIGCGFRFDDDLRRLAQASCEIRAELETVISREQRCFPVVITAPTRNPTVQFNYGLSDIRHVETQVFFSAERPWDARLRTERATYKRVDVLTERNDWVFAGSGCIFAWLDACSPDGLGNSGQPLQAVSAPGSPVPSPDPTAEPATTDPPAPSSAEPV